MITINFHGFELDLDTIPEERGRMDRHGWSRPVNFDFEIRNLRVINEYEAQKFLDSVAGVEILGALQNKIENMREAGWTI